MTSARVRRLVNFGWSIALPYVTPDTPTLGLTVREVSGALHHPSPLCCTERIPLDMADRFSDGAGDMLRSILLFLPKALAFIVILLIGWLIAKAVRKLVDKILERVGFDRLVERGGVKTALAHSKYDASDIIAKLVYYAILLFTLQLAFGIWGPNPISSLITGVVAWLPQAFVAIIIIVVASAIAKGVKDLISGSLAGLSYGKLLANIASVFILGLGIIAALNQIGVATTVTTPILITVLAIIGGVIIVGAGGGLIKPMQTRWEGWLNAAAQESSKLTGRTTTTSTSYTAAPASTDPYSSPTQPLRNDPNNY